MYLRTARLAVVGLLLGLPLSWVPACSQPQRHVTSVGEAASPEDRVGIDDTFDVRVYGESDLTGTFRVATDGTIDYPLAGRVMVAGLRTGEIQQLLVSRLKDRYLKDPQVAGKIETHIFPVADISEGRSQNVMVLPGDVLVVDERIF